MTPNAPEGPQRTPKDPTSWLNLPTPPGQLPGKAAGIDPGPTSTILQKHHFLIRRLHSLSGIVPVGLFVIMHLFTNFQLVAGDFQHEVNFIHSLPALLVVEVGLWIGIGFHAGLGLVYTFTSSPNVQHYPYADNWRYTLQRITGVVALIFIFMHIATLRWHWTFGGLFTTFYVSTKDGYPLAAASTARALESDWIMAAYAIGVLSVVFHWCNGLWTAAITWGLTLSATAMRRWGIVCSALGIALTLFSAGALVGARSYAPHPDDSAMMQQADVEGGGHRGEKVGVME